MKIVVTANDANLDAPVHPVFGRCPTYVFVDPETMQFEVIDNPAIDTLRGAGFHAAEFIVERGAQAVVTGNVGPNAFKVLQASGVLVYLSVGETVREAVKTYKAGRLQPVEEANVPTHSGTTSGAGPRPRDAISPALPASPASREEEITALSETARELCGRLVQVLERLEQLEKNDLGNKEPRADT